MKRLTLVRHGQARTAHPQAGDFDRSLTPHGQRQAVHLGHELMQQNPVPDLLLASPAQRAKHTAQILAQELALPAHRLQYEQRLYLAGPETLLELIRSMSLEVAHLMLVGHNPGLSDLARSLAPDGPLGELGAAEARTMSFDADTWSGVRPGLRPAAAGVLHHRR